MASLDKIANPQSTTVSLGLRLEDGIQPMKSPVTTAVGDVLAVDETVVTNGLYTTMKVVAAGDLTGMGIFGVSLDAIGTANSTGRFFFIGYTPKALMAAATVAGAELSATAASRALTATATAQKVIAKCITATASGVVTDVFFDGVNGFGCLA
jgi:hypothetical protein